MYLLFLNYLHLEKGRGPSFEQTWILLTQGCFVLSLYKIGPVILEKKLFFFNFVNVYWLFRNYLPIEKGGALHLKKKLESMFCTKFGWNLSRGSGEKDENMKYLQQQRQRQRRRRRTTDKLWSENLNWPFC